jgi:hypothetical protein
MSIGQELLNVPMGDMIRQMAFAIADGQMKLDEASMRSAEMMGGLKTIVGSDGNVTFGDSRVFFGAEYITLQQILLQDDGSFHLEGAIPSSATFNWVDTDPTGGIAAAGKTSIKDFPAANASLSFEAFQKHIQNLGKAAGELTGADATLVKKLATTNIAHPANAAKLAMEIRVPNRLSMLELGFAPVFYQFIDTIIEVKISISISQSSESNVSIQSETKNTSAKIGFNPFRGGVRVNSTVTTAQVNASYSSKYSYSAEGSSLLRTKLVPLPPPAILEQRIQAQMEAEAERRAAKISLLSPPVTA